MERELAQRQRIIDRQNFIPLAVYQMCTQTPLPHCTFFGHMEYIGVMAFTITRL